MGFDFVVEYRPGVSNTVADALSHRDAEAPELVAISHPTFNIWSELQQELEVMPVFQKLREQVVTGRKGPSWTMLDGLITVDRRVWVSAAPSLPRILSHAHDTGHEGIQRTLHRLRADFRVPGDKTLVQTCD